MGEGDMAQSRRRVRLAMSRRRRRPSRAIAGRARRRPSEERRAHYRDGRASRRDILIRRDGTWVSERTAIVDRR